MGFKDFGVLKCFGRCLQYSGPWNGGMPVKMKYQYENINKLQKLEDALIEQMLTAANSAKRSPHEKNVSFL